MVIRHAPIFLIEMGVQGGDSILAWSRYFAHPCALIIGIDIHTEWCKPVPDSRFMLTKADQTDPAFWSTIGDSAVDFLIDDCGHHVQAQKTCFDMAWPKVKPGGYYIIEDCHSYGAPELSAGPENLMQWLTRMATEMQDLGATGRGKRGPDRPWSDIDTITFRRGMCIIRKAHG